MAELDLQIDGMHCGACVRRVAQALESVAGATEVKVRIGAAHLQVEDSDASREAVLAALTKAGYTAQVEE